jgi:hypothetical protein
MFCYNEALTRKSVVISGPRLGEGIGQPGALDQAMVMAYRNQTNISCTGSGRHKDIGRWWCSLAGLDS